MPVTSAAPLARGALVVWLAICSGCTLLNPTDYLSKDYGKGEGALHPCQSTDGSLLFCEDFETGSLDSARWGSREPSARGPRDVDAARAHAGAYSLHARILPDAQAGTVYAVATHHQAFPSHFFTRAFVYADADSGTVPETVLSIQRADGSSGAQLGLQQSWADPRAEALALNFWGNGGATDQVMNTFALGSWQCVEAEVDEDLGIVRAWLEAGSTLESAGLVLEAFDDVELGVSYTGQVVAERSVWLDDLVVSTQRVGCGP